jgi:hypothetical protein
MKNYLFMRGIQQEAEDCNLQLVICGAIGSFGLPAARAGGEKIFLLVACSTTTITYMK